MINLFKFFLCVVFLLSAIAGKSKQISLQVKAPEYSNQTLFLAYYWDNKVLKSDSVTLDNAGNGMFSNHEGSGIYVLYKESDDRFDFLIGEDTNFSMTVSGKLSTKSVDIQGAPSSQAFINYQAFLSEQKKKQNQLRTEYKGVTPKSSEAIALSERMKKLNEVMEKKWSSIEQEFPNSFLADFVSLMRPTTVPEFTLPKSTPKYDSLKWVSNYNFKRDHSFDNVNFNQSGILRTPIFGKRLEQYFTRTLLQHPDSILMPTLSIIEKSKVNSDVYSFVANWFLTRSINSKIMGMDKVFVAIAQSHHLQPNQKLVEETSRLKISQKVARLTPNLIGLEAKDIIMKSQEGEFISLHEIDKVYTVLYFYEPGCNHCQVATPELYKSVFIPFHEQGVEVFAVNIYEDKSEWEEFIQKNQLYDWINVWDPENISNFRSYYNVETTPAIYLLDENKKIIAKQIDVKSLKSILEQLLH